MQLEARKFFRNLFLGLIVQLCLPSPSLFAAKPDLSAYAIGGVSRASLSAPAPSQDDGKDVTLADVSKTFSEVYEVRKIATQRGSWALIVLAIALILYIPTLLQRRPRLIGGASPDLIEETPSVFLLMWSSPANAWVLVERSGPNGRARTVAALREGTVVGGAMLAKERFQRYRLSADHIWRPTDEDERLVTDEKIEPPRRQGRG